jgi:UDP:flavonoid glycosyltransferase YjiC (YdhE family)
MKYQNSYKGRIVLSTFGSLGDINPFIALALGLQQRGYQAVIATIPFYRDYVGDAGLPFYPIRPDMSPEDKDLLRRAMHPSKGPAVILKDIVLPYIHESYADLNAAVQNADALITHPLSFAGHIAAEKNNLPWISVVLAPIIFFSAYDMPVLPGFPFTTFLGKMGPAANRLFIRLVKYILHIWCRPIYRLRANLGLTPGEHPIFKAQYSPTLVLAMFSDLLARPRSDWPSNTRITGFPFYDTEVEQRDSFSQLEPFLNDGLPPLVFALGSVAVYRAGDFYQEAVKAAAMLNRRAVLVLGKETDNLPVGKLPPEIITIDYTPYSKLFPKAAVIVHQGGIGTTGQALKAGKPTLVVPYAHDQPDNALRLERLGTSRTLSLKRCTAYAMARALEKLLGDEEIIRHADIIGEKVRSEDGVAVACEAIEAVINSRRKTRKNTDAK